MGHGGKNTGCNSELDCETPLGENRSSIFVPSGVDRSRSGFTIFFLHLDPKTKNFERMSQSQTAPKMFFLSILQTKVTRLYKYYVNNNIKSILYTSNKERVQF